MINKFSEWRKRVIEDSVDKDENVDFNVYVMYSKSDEAFVILGSINNSAPVYVSSQRLDRRLFKTLDTVRKCLHENDIYIFTVVQ